MWIPTEHEKYGVVLASFRGTVQHGLPLEIGDTVQILEKCEGWYRGFVLKNPNAKGIFPCSYIHLKNAHIKNKGQFETVIPTEDSVITEMTSTLREWGSMWKQLYVRNEGDLFHRLWHVMNEILDLRRQVLVGHLTHDRMRDVKQHITARLDWGNEQLGLDLVPRREFSMVDPDEISVTELYRLMEHRHRKKETPVPASTHHLFVQVKSLMSSNLGEELDVFLYIYDGRESRALRFGLSVSMQLLHGDMEQLRREYMVLFTRGVSVTKKLGFSDIIMPGEMRNDLYVTLERGEFEKGGKSVARNVEITVYALDIDGQILKGQVAAGAGEAGGDEYHSFVLYHNNSPRWSEQIKLPIPVDMFRGSHVRFEFRHCSTKDKGEKKLFGYSFVPLMQEDGRTLPDGTHELIIHKCEDNMFLQDCTRYLKLPFSKGNLPGNNQAVKGSKESFWITSFLCSTKLTQNGDMLDLLKWRGHPERITDSLSKLKEIDGSEIVKFLQDTLDTLFGILDESSQRYGLKVFDSLVHIINLLQDSKFQHFKPVMDTYIESHFAGALSYRDLIKVLKWYVDRIIDAEHQDHFQQVLKATEYIFKYIIQSRRLFSLATGGQHEDEFRCCMRELFYSIRFFLSQESKGSMPVAHTQAVFLRTFPAVYGELLKLFSVREVATFVHDTLGSLPTTPNPDCPLEAIKLQCIARTVESQLYTNPESRCILLPVVLRLLHAHMQEQRELVMCAGILTSMLSLIKKEDTCSMLKASIFAKASYTLLLYDELLEWSERPLREFLNYPMQSEWQRKEYLHLTIIENFDRGKSWENGIILCRELADQYEAYYDYRNLSKMRMKEASLYDKIMDQQRLEPEFFRVGFYGKKFPFFLRNKEFVCRGHDYERLEAFQQRMLNEFPHAIAMQHANQPDQTIYQAEAQYLQIYAVTPIPDSQDVLQRDGVPDNIKSFYKVNHIWRFRYDRPFHKGTKDKENEFKSLWVERTTLTLVQSLPGISRWFEVEKRELVEVSPLENAIEVIENKNLQLRTLITQCQTRQMQNINPLTMCLNGVIDAAVNGGLARYQEAFFVKDYIVNHPEDGDKIGRLRELMFEQAHILEFGLAVHEKFVPQDMRPLHKKLVDQFHLMKSSLGIQEFPAYVRASPIHFTNGSPRTCRNSAPNIMCPPEGGRVVARRSPLTYPAVNRYSSSSLSSQASNEVSNITGQSESSDEVFNMQPSPSTSSLSSNHSASPNVTSSAPSSARGSPQLPDKHKHSRENACLSPRDRPCSAIYPNPLDPTQRMNAHQMGDSTLPRSEPNISAPDKVVRPAASSWSLDCVKEASTPPQPASDRFLCPPVPPRPTYSVGSPAKNTRSQSPITTLRSPQKNSAPPFTPSPTECQPAGLVSNSPALSGSYSSGISSLSRCSVSEASGTEGPPTGPGSGPPDGNPPLLPPSTLLPNSASERGLDELGPRRDSKTPPPYSVFERSNPRRPMPLPHSLSVPPQVDPPALPPKPHQMRCAKPDVDPRRPPPIETPRPRVLPRKVSQL
ncbi:LOW QUALITY PROTEIN: dedicator of cytokinesis protein 4b [Alosa sapidissima]|uniref:LOW QUALITY PROTEIN: dedicator of cytokinesis protein 4b n=1 Tax=Alosa sapidissima TaxID=34773 RepID=UPI001C08C6B0|nr:LOW QUALITY PROTEIN: dedicator of cytokinesis protein 4b [Alosa sapidissima]